MERRPVKKMLGNIQVDSLARNRRWRSQCVFRIHVERPVKEGIEVVRVFLSPQPEHVELTSREHSPPPTLIWSPPPTRPMPTRHILGGSSSVRTM